jgi:hypothetical protein
MSNKKQRRRREKTFRHDYGFVTYDDDGNEVQVEASQIREKKPDKPKAAAGKRGGSARSQRIPPQPSWRRAARRGGLWGGVMLIVVVLFFKNMPVGNRVFLGLLYAAAFIPLTYWIDRMAYRNYLRRNSKS